MILSSKANVMAIRRFCLEDDEKWVLWVIRFHVVKNSWSCTSIEIVLIKVRSIVNDVLYIVIMIIIGSIKAWGFNLFWELLIWTWNLEVVKNYFLIQLGYIYIYILSMYFKFHGGTSTCMFWTSKIYYWS